MRVYSNFVRSITRCTAFFALSMLHAQSPNDAILMPAKNVCVLANFDAAHFNKYWEGAALRKNQTIATVHRTTVLPMIALGLTDRLNFYVSTPYVQTKSSEPNGGKLAGVKGIQDINLAIKYAFIKKELERGEFIALASLGFSTPLGKYAPDYQPYSLGLGTQELSPKAIAQYKLQNGLYVRGTLGYLWRAYAEADRDYYYNNGSFYTKWMDVPNAWNYEVAMGIWLFRNRLKAECVYTGLKSTSGDDIRAYAAPQPTNKVKFDRVSVDAQYYPTSKGIGLLVYYGQVLNGRNAPKMTNFGGGLTYQFGFVTREKASE